MMKTIVGYFDDWPQVEMAKSELQGIGIMNSDIETYSARGKEGRDEKNFLTRIKKFFSNLGNDYDTDYYAEGIRRGGTALCVTCDESRIDEVADCMNRCGAVDTDRKAQYFKERGFSKYDWNAKPLTDDEAWEERQEYTVWEKSRFAGDKEEVIPVIEESVSVNKRAVNKGNVRIYTRVTETPVEEEINLRNERVEIERNAVNRPVNASDMSAFQEGEINLRETSEEPVINKEARVVEEVRVRKTADERTEKVHDTARKTNVEVDRTDDLTR